MFALAFGTQKMGRPAAAPPGVPTDRADALRQAFGATMADPEFLEDAKRSSLEVDGPISGMEVDAILRQIYATPKDVIAKFEAIRNEK
jgi:tripartite-type tricarboxylate transporter receptor subunit TctC